MDHELILSLPSLSISGISAWISCLIATAIEVLDNNRFVTIICLFNIDGDITTDTSHTVISTINGREDTTLDSQRHTTRDIGLIRATKDVLDLAVVTATGDTVILISPSELASSPLPAP